MRKIQDIRELSDDDLIRAFLSYVTSSGNIHARTISTRQLSRYIFCQQDYDSRDCEPSHSAMMRVKSFLKKLHMAGILQAIAYKRGRRVKYVLSSDFAQVLLQDREEALNILKRALKDRKRTRPSYV